MSTLLWSVVLFAGSVLLCASALWAWRNDWRTMAAWEEESGIDRTLVRMERSRAYEVAMARRQSERNEARERWS